MTILVNYLVNRIRKGKSPLVLIVGEQRAGKTALGLRIAFEIERKLGTTFNIAEQMFFKIEDFATAMNKFNKKVLILDEAGVSLDPYEHMSITQRVYNHIIQTQAYKQNVIFLILPFASEIGKQHRKHVNAIVQVLSHGAYKLYATFKWFADLSFKPPRVMHLETVIGVPLPPNFIWQVYTEEFQKQYKQDILNLQRDILQFKTKGAKGKERQKIVPLPSV